jgi:hypothetical protein
MRRLTLISGALVLLFLLGGVAIAGAAPKAEPADTKAKKLSASTCGSAPST